MVVCFSTYQLTEVWYIYMFGANTNMDIMHNCNPGLSVDKYFPLFWSHIKKLCKKYFSLFRKNFRLSFQSICTILDIFHLFSLLKKFYNIFWSYKPFNPNSHEICPFYVHPTEVLLCAPNRSLLLFLNVQSPVPTAYVLLEMKPSIRLWLSYPGLWLKETGYFFWQSSIDNNY